MKRTSTRRPIVRAAAIAVAALALVADQAGASTVADSAAYWSGDGRCARYSWSLTNEQLPGHLTFNSATATGQGAFCATVLPLSTGQIYVEQWRYRRVNGTWVLVGQATATNGGSSALAYYGVNCYCVLGWYVEVTRSSAYLSGANRQTTLTSPAFYGP